MLRDRLQTSVVLVAIVSGLLYLDGSHSIPGAEGLWLLPLLLFFALGSAWDLAHLLVGSNRLISVRTTIVATLVVTLSACVPLLWPLAGQAYPVNCPVGKLGWIVIGGAVAIFTVLAGEMYRYGQGPKGAIERTSVAVFVSLYVGIPMALMVALRSMGSGNWGLAALLTMIAVTKSADAGAYFTGKAFGRHKLIPRLSPGKTREGAVGGILIATVVAYLCLEYLFPRIAGAPAGPISASGPSGIGAPTSTPSLAFLAMPLGGALVLGPVLAVAGMIGDLAESLVKRDCGAKDSGRWLPGLGGVWDVTDSLIAAVTPAFLCFAAGVGA